MEINQRRWTRRVYTEWQGNLLTEAVTFCLHYAKSRHDFPSRVTLPPAPLEDGRNRWWKGDGRGPSSHQLRLEINRRQMRRGAYRATSPLADFSHPPPTIRLFSTNTKRYTRPTTPFHFIYTLPWHPPRIPRGSLDFSLIRFSN